jgi:arylsulfatase
MAYNAPHFPLQAEPEDIAIYRGRFDQGWDKLRAEKFERMQAMGLIDPNWTLSPKEASDVLAWEDEPHKEWRLRAMEVYAALVDRMDRNIGRIVRLLEDAGQFDNTMIIFLSDNGGNAEFPNIKDPSVLPGGNDYETAYGHYGNGWANLSNTPFRMYKHYIHEGGIASPFIVHWPARLKEPGVLRGQPVQLTDVMATVVDATDSTYPTEYNGHSIYPMEGVSMMPIFERGDIHKEYLFWEHEGNCGVRRNEWKLVRFYKKPWELYHMDQDGTETRNLAAEQPELVQQLAEQYDLWTKRTNVLTQEEYEKFDSRPNRRRKKQQL